MTINEGNAFTDLNIKSDRTSGTIGGVNFVNASNAIKGQVFGTTGGDVYIYTGGQTEALRLDASQNATFAGDVTIGTADSGNRALTISGGATGNAEGGELRLATAADYDSTYDFYRLDVFQDDLRIGRAGTTDLYIFQDGKVKVENNFEIGTGGTITSDYFTTASGLATAYVGTTSASFRTGRNANEYIQLNVTDSTGSLTYVQDETGSVNHSFTFNIASSSTGANRFNFAKDLNVNGGSVLRMGGIEIIDASTRNMTNIGTISSGDIDVSATNTNGLSIIDSSNSSASPLIKVQGNRSDANKSQSFSGGLALSALYTGGLAPDTKHTGTIYFGTNHTDGTAANIAYSASISGILEGDANSATDMPTGLVFYTGDAGTALGTAQTTYGTERMRIDHDGNVGIGTDNPLSILHLYANDPQILLDDSGTQSSITGQSGNILYKTSSTNRDHVFFGVNNEKFRITGDGILQVGSLQTTILDASRNLQNIAQFSSTGVHLVGITSGVGVGATPADANSAELGPGFLNLARDDTADAKQILFGKNGVVHSYIKTTLTNNGLVIGCSTSDVLNVNSVGIIVTGSITATGDVTAFQSSDERLKTNLVKIDSALNKVSQISGYHFEWKDIKDAPHQGKDVGVIAQEIEKVLPEVVHERDTGYKAVNYQKLTALLIEAVKELKEEIDELKRNK
jgi:hypothetical protein